MNFAMIKNGSNFVENIIVADPDFTLDGYYFVEIKDNVFCQSGMYYNANDGLFYLDPDLKNLPGLPEQEPASNKYKKELSIISNQYKYDVSLLEYAYSLSLLAAGSAQLSKQNLIRNQYEELKSKFSSDLAAIKSKYGV